MISLLAASARVGILVAFVASTLGIALRYEEAEDIVVNEKFGVDEEELGENLAHRVHLQSSEHGFATGATKRLRRLLIDYDSTLNPGQSNHALTNERAELLGTYMSKWKNASVDIYLLTASGPQIKEEMLEAAGLLHYFKAVASSSHPKRYKSKADAIQHHPSLRWSGSAEEQLFVDDLWENIKSVWEPIPDSTISDTGIASTLRLEQNSGSGLVETDLQLIDKFVTGQLQNMTHVYSFSFMGTHLYDMHDTWLKCVLTSLDQDTQRSIIGGNPLALEGRPDLRAIANTD